VAAASASGPSTAAAPASSAAPRSLSRHASRTKRGPSRARGRRAHHAGGAAAVRADETSPPAVRRALRELSGCVPALPANARSLLRRRAGSRSAAPRSLAALSAGLGIPRAAVVARLRRAVGALRTVARSTGCAGTSIAASPLQGAATLLGDAGGTPPAGRSAVLGASAHGGPSSRDPAPGTGVAPRAAAEEAAPSIEWLLVLALLMLAVVGAGGLVGRRFGPSRRPRPRRRVSPRAYALALRAGFRYSYPRDALVLRGVGERFGPVLVRDRGRGRTARRPLASAGHRVAGSRRWPRG
jgi:hypothetical protein